VGHPDVEFEPFSASSFPTEPELECDIVMKGGITSGVIYPLAVCELAQIYKLRSVGAASAGAIAAAAAAAAEAGRPTGASTEGVDCTGLAGFPKELTATALVRHSGLPQAGLGPSLPASA
jgi:hypothetical protein